MKNKQALKKLCDDLFWSLLILVSLVGGAYWAYWGITQESLAKASKRWPSVIGQVVSSDTRVARSKGGLNYFPEVTYRYSIHGVDFKNDTIYFGEISHRRDDAGEMMTKYPPGKSVPVYYNPKALGTACLEPGKYRSISGVSVFLGLYIFTFGFFGLLFRWFVLSLKRSTK